MKRLTVVMIILMAVLSCGKKESQIKATTTLTDPKAIFEQAQKHEAAMEYAQACDLYNTIITNFPQSEYRYKAIFMHGYAEMEYLKDYDQAKRDFELLLKEYPDCDLADDAKIMRDAAASGRSLIEVFQELPKKSDK